MNVAKLLKLTKMAVVAGLFTTVGVVATSASACDTACVYKPVVTYVCQEQPYQVCVTRYDHCGNPYHAYVTAYRTVHVPVTKWVKVCY